MKFSKYLRALMALMLMAFWQAPALAQVRYDLSSGAEDLKAAKWEAGGAFAGVTVLGLNSWNWGSSNSFQFNPEGWFGKKTGSGGADKLGHAFTSYALTNAARAGQRPSRTSRLARTLSAAITTQAIMLYVETFDVLSNDHGFA